MVAMLAQVKVEIIRFIDDSQPGWVECRLVDAWQREWLFEEKVPIVTSEYLGSESSYPAQGAIDCIVIGRKTIGPQEVVTIDTSKPWSVNSVGGETCFDVLPDNLSLQIIAGPE